MPNYTPEALREGYTLLSQHLERTGLIPSDLEEVTLETVRAWLAVGVRHLLDQNMEGLLQLCYRIDLSENRVQEVLTLSKPEQVAEDFAQLILEREMQKVFFRMKYRQAP